MAFDCPNFMLQFDHESSLDQNTDSPSIKTSGKNGGCNLKANKVSMTSNGSSKLNYSTSNSQTINNGTLGTSSNSDQACNVDETMSNESDIQDSEISKYTNYSEMLRDLGQESKMVVLQYSQVFGDSEVYEQQASQAIADLTAHTQLLLQNLNEQKKFLCSRINSISEALKN